MRLVLGEVHVWRLDLNIPAAVVSQLNRTLDEDERAQVACLLFDADRSHFVAAHGYVRRLLGSCLGLTPEALRYDHDPHGKPRIRIGLRDTKTPLRFNLSSSDDTALLAVSLDREVGVDVEKVRTERDSIGIAERFFSPREAAALRRLADQRQVPAFCRCWTRKEAYVKATGDGMFLPLNSFVVSIDSPYVPLAREKPEAVFSSAGEVSQRRWKMIGLPESAGFTAALVVESDEVHSSHSILKQRDPIARFLVVSFRLPTAAQRRESSIVAAFRLVATKSGGRLVDSPDPAAWCRSIGDLLTSPELYRELSRRRSAIPGTPHEPAHLAARLADAVHRSLLAGAGEHAERCS
jgi:4'-phosphopantetheinyl transferase